MWAAGDLPFAIALALLVHHWLAMHEATTPRLDQLVAGAVDRGWPGALPVDRRVGSWGD